MPPISPATSHRVAGVAGLLTTAADRPADWVHAGQALQRVLLTASLCGAAVALHSQPLELSWLREFLRTQLGDGTFPHLVFRIGLVTQVALSVRRDPDDVLFHGGQAKVCLPPGEWRHRPYRQGKDGQGKVELSFVTGAQGEAHRPNASNLTCRRRGRRAVTNVPPGRGGRHSLPGLALLRVVM
jgi:hypothetical protein